MKPHESPRINKKSIRGDSGDSWPVWNRGMRKIYVLGETRKIGQSKINFQFVQGHW